MHTLWSQQQVAFNANCGKNRKHMGHSVRFGDSSSDPGHMGAKYHRKCLAQRRLAAMHIHCTVL